MTTPTKAEFLAAKVGSTFRIDGYLRTIVSIAPFRANDAYGNPSDCSDSIEKYWDWMGKLITDLQPPEPEQAPEPAPEAKPERVTRAWSWYSWGRRISEVELLDGTRFHDSLDGWETCDRKVYDWMNELFGPDLARVRASFAEWESKQAKPEPADARRVFADDDGYRWVICQGTIYVFNFRRVWKVAAGALSLDDFLEHTKGNARFPNFRELLGPERADVLQDFDAWWKPTEQAPEQREFRVFDDCGREVIEVQNLRITVRMGRDLNGEKTMYIGKPKNGAEISQSDVRKLLPYLEGFAKSGKLAIPPSGTPAPAPARIAELEAENTRLRTMMREAVEEDRKTRREFTDGYFGKKYKSGLSVWAAKMEQALKGTV